jgi:hypothetical protein
MPRPTRALATVAALTLAALTLVVPRLVAAQDASAPAPLAWLAGCWEARSTRRVVQELWLPPVGGTLVGVSRTVRRGATADGDQMVEFEYLRIVPRDGRWVYVAQPSGRPPTEFTASAAGDTAVTFTNLAHDFPQQILYRRVGADSLVARVEGSANGQERGIEFRYARATCTAQ